jgi:hypothetical protein
MASGKTRTLGIIKQALLAAGAPVEEINVAFHEVQNKGPKKRVDEFTVAASPSGRACGSDGHRETWSIHLGPGARHSPHVNKGTQWQATFNHQHHARAFIQFVTATQAQREAIAAILADPNFSAASHFRRNPKNCQGGGGDFAEGAGVISAEMAPAIHNSLPGARLNASPFPPNLGQPASPPAADTEWLRGALERMIDRWECQSKTMQGLYDLLGVAGDMFDRYAEEHERKASNELDDSRAAVSWDKAERNSRMARMCRAVIPTISELPPIDVVEFTSRSSL